MTSQDQELVHSDVAAIMTRAKAHSNNTVVDCLSDASEVNLSKSQVQQKAWSNRTRTPNYLITDVDVGGNGGGLIMLTCTRMAGKQATILVLHRRRF